MVLEVSVSDVLRLKKVHPCGGYLWEVYRTGADLGLRCTTCDRRVLLPRSKVERRVKEIVRAEGSSA